MNSLSFDLASLLAELNREQHSAVMHTAGPLLVLAGAGTGKTRVITARIANLLAGGVQPESILAVSFTRKAGNEMKTRLMETIGEKADAVRVSTFHALGLLILREQHDAAQLQRNFKVSDEKQRLKICERVLQQAQTRFADEEDSLSPRDLLRRISFAKSCGSDAQTLLASEDHHDQFIGAAMREYNLELREQQLIDLDDMISLPVQMLERDHDMQQSYRQRYRHLLIDEYQDTNLLQHRLMNCLLGPDRNICVVGDDDQSIYGFRGADRRLILGFAKEFPDTKVVKLTANYRCSRQIIRVANAVIHGSPGRFRKTLVSANGSSVPVKFFETADPVDERNFVVSDVLNARECEQRSFGEFAVLVRGRKEAREMTRSFQEREIPCGAKEKGVRVMTLHASKGLEFPAVYLPGIYENNLPHWNAIKGGDAAVEEERRLLYVGVTRAKEKLTLSSIRRRGPYSCSSSRFVAKLLQHRLVEYAADN